MEREATHQADLERLSGSLEPDTVDGVFVVSPDLYVKFSSLLLYLATENRLPFPGYWKEWVAQRPLFSYAPNIRTIGVAAAEYMHKILNGAKPANLPVQQLTTFELVINLKTVRALGLTIPPFLLFQADEVIQ